VFFGPSISFGHSKNGKKQADAGDDFSHIFSPQEKKKDNEKNFSIFEKKWPT